jgi:hypothetical protein
LLAGVRRDVYPVALDLELAVTAIERAVAVA